MQMCVWSSPLFCFTWDTDIHYLCQHMTQDWISGMYWSTGARWFLYPCWNLTELQYIWCPDFKVSAQILVWSVKSFTNPKLTWVTRAANLSSLLHIWLFPSQVVLHGFLSSNMFMLAYNSSVRISGLVILLVVGAKYTSRAKLRY